MGDEKNKQPKRVSYHLLPQKTKEEETIRVLRNIRDLDFGTDERNRNYGASVKKREAEPVVATKAESFIIPIATALPSGAPEGAAVIVNGVLYVAYRGGWIRIENNAEKIEIVDNFPQNEEGKLVFYAPENKLYFSTSTEWIDIIVVKVGDTLPSVAVPNSLFYRTTDKHLYIADNNQWVDITGRSDVIGVGTSFPSNPVAGQEFYRSDEKKHYVYDGNRWVDVTGRSDVIETGTSFPANPVTGQEFYRSDTGKHYVYDGNQWVDVSGGVGFGTSFPSNPQEGDLFYRTDKKRLYAYDGTNWKTQEAVQTTPPASPVVGEIWFEDSNNAFKVGGSFDTFTLGISSVSITPTDANSLFATPGYQLNYASRSDHGHSLIVHERRFHGGYDNKTLYYNTDTAPFFLYNMGSYLGGAGPDWVALPSTFQEECRISNKSVSAGNNDVVIAQHPNIPVDVFKYQVLATETTQVDFWAEQVFRLVWYCSYNISSVKVYVTLYVKGQASFTYRFNVEGRLYHFPTGAVYSANANVDVATNYYGYGSNKLLLSITPTNTNPLVVGVRITRRRSAEAVGNRPDDCYVLPIVHIRE